MNPRRIRPGRHRAVVAAYGIACGLIAGGVVALVAAHAASGRGGLYDSWPLTLSTGICSAGLGLLLLSRRPDQRLGWVIAALGALTLLQTLIDSYAAYSVHVSRLPGAAAVFAFDELPGGLLVGVLALLLLLFPTGRLPAPRWRMLGVAIVAVSAAGLPGRLLRPGHFANLPALVNPLGAHVPGVSSLTAIANAAGVPLLLASAASVVVRWRRADRITREQIKSLLAAVALWPLVIVILLATPTSFSDSRWGELLFALPIDAMLIAVAVAVMRYRLYEIDRVISRTLSYFVLTGVLVGCYLGCVWLTTSALPFSSSVSVAASTLVVAAAFNPMRRRIQAAVDRRFNRAKYDAARAVEGFAARLRDDVDTDDVRRDLLTATAYSMQPESVSLWVAG